MPKDASQPDSGIFGPAVEAAEMRPLADLVPYARNSRTHSPEQVDQIVRSMETYGWTVPILVDPDGGVIAGHGRLLAAEKIGWTRVPCLVARGWSDEQKRLYVIADNQLALNADWDEELLALELGELRAAGLEISLSGFDADALAAMLDPPAERGDPEAVPEVPVVSRSRIGDLYVLGEHRLLCGDATNAADVARLLGDASPHLMVTDPPYGVEYDPEWREKAGVAGADLQRGGNQILRQDRRRGHRHARRPRHPAPLPRWLLVGQLQGPDFRLHGVRQLPRPSPAEDEKTLNARVEAVNAASALARREGVITAQSAPIARQIPGDRRGSTASSAPIQRPLRPSFKCR